ncbi:uncharacterized protein LOC128954267 [Oppia nitens]|uniref:uncharacterized protein LOC128954267 n=1 Tax=Oppia nitens TaxID=1686743 RepID=UPI0023DB913A|nr:uncharacterized protein LOC128954267 [Oppia nitens]
MSTIKNTITDAGKAINIANSMDCSSVEKAACATIGGAIGASGATGCLQDCLDGGSMGATVANIANSISPGCLDPGVCIATGVVVGIAANVDGEKIMEAMKNDGQQDKDWAEMCPGYIGASDI